MSATVRGLDGKRTLEIAPSVMYDDEIFLSVADDSHDLLGAHVSRVALLAAISSELGVVIIDQADMPEVDVAWAGAVRADGQTAAEVRQSALVRLALADYLEANPPVDEAAVNSILSDMVKAPVATPDAIARHLATLGYEKAARS